MHVFSPRLILAMDSTVTTFHQIRLINQRFGLKPGQAGNMLKPHLCCTPDAKVHLELPDDIV